MPLVKPSIWWHTGPLVFKPSNYEALGNSAGEESRGPYDSFTSSQWPSGNETDGSFDILPESESDGSSQDTIFSRGGILRRKDKQEMKPRDKLSLMFSRHWRYRFDSSYGHF